MPSLDAPDYTFARFLIERGIALIYVIAFLVAANQFPARHRLSGVSRRPGFDRLQLCSTRSLRSSSRTLARECDYRLIDDSGQVACQTREGLEMRLRAVALIENQRIVAPDRNARSESLLQLAHRGDRRIARLRRRILHDERDASSMQHLEHGQKWRNVSCPEHDARNVPGIKDDLALLPRIRPGDAQITRLEPIEKPRPVLRRNVRVDACR